MIQRCPRTSAAVARNVGAAGLLWIACGFAPAWGAVPTEVPAAGAAVAQAQLSEPAAPAKPAVRARGKADWTALSPVQQHSLAPLAGTWNSMGAADRRKWLALSENFTGLPATEQQVLHSRMRDWAALSTRQRAQARLNFGETRQLSAAEKKARWAAYQALPPDERNKLAAQTQASPPATAAAVKPVPRQKLATLPGAGPDARTPRIAAGLAADGAPADAAPAPSTLLPLQQAH